MIDNGYIPEHAEAVVVAALVESLLADVPESTLTLAALGFTADDGAPLGFDGDDPDYYERYES